MRILAAKIIEQAIEDYRLAGHLHRCPQKGKRIKEIFDCAEEMGFATPKEELLTFFNSRLFGELCGILNIDPQLIHDAVIRGAKVKAGTIIGAGKLIYQIEE